MTSKWTQIKLLGIFIFIIIIALIILLPYFGIFLDASLMSYTILAAIFLIILGTIGERLAGSGSFGYYAHV
jgi:hypothetical protein